MADGNTIAPMNVPKNLGPKSSIRYVIIKALLDLDLKFYEPLNHGKTNLRSLTENDESNEYVFIHKSDKYVLKFNFGSKSGPNWQEHLTATKVSSGLKNSDITIQAFTGPQHVDKIVKQVKEELYDIVVEPPQQDRTSGTSSAL